MYKKSLLKKQKDTTEESNSGKGGRKGGTPLTELVSRQELEDLYLIQEKSLEDIAQIFGCTRQMVRILMERHDIQRRNRSNARTSAIKHNKFELYEHDNINEVFFSIWTPAMAWILGLLFTDGYIMETGSGLRVILSSVDIEMLEKVRAHLGSNRAIQKKVQTYDKTRHIFVFEFFRERMRADLISLGLRQRKSLNMLFPDVPEPLMRHFIRGCWDGDGTVYIDKEGKFNASYVTGSLDFITRLVEELHHAGVAKIMSKQSPEIRAFRKTFGEESFNEYFPKFTHRDALTISRDSRSKSTAYTIKLNSRSNLDTLFHYFYDGVDDTMYLRRKYDVFVKGLNISEETQKACRELPFRYTTIPIRNENLAGSVSNQGATDYVLHKGNKGQNKKVLRIKNDDGRLKCKRCGAAAEILHMINEAYCPACFAECYKHIMHN